MNFIMLERLGLLPKAKKLPGEKPKKKGGKK
jgi:hypothetical protein